jgi:hypothetical protein
MEEFVKCAALCRRLRSRERTGAVSGITCFRRCYSLIVEVGAEGRMEPRLTRDDVRLAKAAIWPPGAKPDRQAHRENVIPGHADVPDQHEARIKAQQRMRESPRSWRTTAREGRR